MLWGEVGEEMKWFWKKQRGRTVARLEDAAKRAQSVWYAATREYLAAMKIDLVRAKGAGVAVNDAYDAYLDAAEKLYAAKLKEGQ